MGFSLGLVSLGNLGHIGIQNANDSQVVVCPFAGQLEALVLRTDVAADANLDFEFHVNGVDSGVRMRLPNASVAGGYRLAPNARVNVQPGDALEILGDAAQTAAMAAEESIVMRRMDALRSLNEYFLRGSTFPAIEVVNNVSDVVAVPEDGQLLGAFINVHTVIGAPDHSFDVLKNGADTAGRDDADVNMILPGGTPDETGVFCALDAVVPVAAGDSLQLRSNGEQVAVTSVDFTWVFDR